ncbi:L-asparaginase 2 [Fusarium oxysporum f. sp. albedinis]|nr:L-asparaginase 2 [Fusarium oxysporum f. sp. albedinis]
MDLLGVARLRQDDMDIASKTRESLVSGDGSSFSCQSYTNPACQRIAGAPRNIRHLTMIVGISHSPP